MSLISFLRALPIDLGQREYKYTTKGKQIALEHVPVAKEGSTALDIGCGDGYWSEKLKARGYLTTSIDIPREYPNADADVLYVDTVYMDANESLAFADASFDLVWCSEALEFFSNWENTLSEIQRILKPGGRVIITTPNSFFWLHHFLKFFGLENKDWQNPGHVNFYSVSDSRRFFPGAVVYGYFPYVIVKMRITRGIGFLSPSLVVVYTNPS